MNAVKACEGFFDAMFHLEIIENQSFTRRCERVNPFLGIKTRIIEGAGQG